MQGTGMTKSGRQLYILGSYAESIIPMLIMHSRKINVSELLLSDKTISGFRKQSIIFLDIPA